MYVMLETLYLTLELVTNVALPAGLYTNGIPHSSVMLSDICPAYHQCSCLLWWKVGSVIYVRTYVLIQYTKCGVTSIYVHTSTYVCSYARYKHSLLLCTISIVQAQHYTIIIASGATNVPWWIQNPEIFHPVTSQCPFAAVANFPLVQWASWCPTSTQHRQWT